MMHTNLLLAGLGMLACIALMAVAMPLAMRLGRRLPRLTRSSASPDPDPASPTTTTGPQPSDAAAPRPPRQSRQQPS